MLNEPQEKRAFINNTTKWVVAGLVGLGSGITSFVTHVRAEFFENVKHFPEAKKALEEHGHELGRIKESRRKGEIDTDTFIRKYHKEKDRYADEVSKISEELGIYTKDLDGLTKGSAQRFLMLSENSRIPVVFGAVATTVIGFAGTSMFLNSLANRHKINQIAKHQQQDQEQSRS